MKNYLVVSIIPDLDPALDIIPPGGVTNPFGCIPAGRIINTTVTLGPGQLANVFADSYPGDPTPGDGKVTFSCTNHAGATGSTYTLIGAVDAHADDGGACGPGSIQSIACFNALASDDNDSSDNRVTRNAPRVQKP